MKKGLLVLLIIGLFLFGCPKEPPRPAEMPQDQKENQIKVYSLKDFLNSVYAYEIKGGENQLSVAATLAGKEFLIKIPVENWTVKDDEENNEDYIFGVDLFHRHELTIYNKQKTKSYKVAHFSIVAPPNGFRVNSEDINQNRQDYSDYRHKELLTAFLDGKPKENVKITGYINGWGCRTDRNCSYFRYIEFELTILKVEVD